MTAPAYGAEHQADRRRLLAALKPGQACWRCGEGMWPHQELHRGHLIDIALGGQDGPAALEHAKCSTSAGARLGNALRQMTGRPANRARRHRAPQVCVICGSGYLPSRAGQLACSRACGWVLRRRNAAVTRQAVTGRGAVTGRVTDTAAAAVSDTRAATHSRQW